MLGTHRVLRYGPTLGDARRALASIAHLPDDLPIRRDDNLPWGIFAISDDGSPASEAIFNIPPVTP